MMSFNHKKLISVFTLFVIVFAFCLDTGKAATTSMITDSFTVQMGSKTFSLNPLCAQDTVQVSWKITIGSAVSLNISGSDGTKPVSRTGSSGQIGSFTAKCGVTYTISCLTSMTQYGPATVLVSCSYPVYGQKYKFTFGSISPIIQSYCLFLPAAAYPPGTYSWTNSTGGNSPGALIVYPYPVKICYFANTPKLSENYTLNTSPYMGLITYPGGQTIFSLSGAGAEKSGTFILPANQGINIYAKTGNAFGYQGSPGYIPCNLEIIICPDDHAPPKPGAPVVTSPSYSGTDGILYTKNPVTIEWNAVTDKGPISGLESGVQSYSIYNSNGTSTILANSTSTQQTLNLSDGLYTLALKARDLAGNESGIGSGVNVVLDGSIGSVDPNPVSFPSRNSAVLSWSTLSDVVEGKQGSGIKGYQVVVTKNDTSPTNSINDPALITCNQASFDGLSSKNTYYGWVRAVDNVGNISEWARTEAFAPLPETPLLTGKAVYLEENGQLSNKVKLVVADVDAVEYIIGRQVKGDETTKVVLAQLTYDQMQQKGFNYLDTSNLLKHTTYTYFVIVKNVLGQSLPAVSCDVSTNNAQLSADETWSGTRRIEGSITVPAGRTLTIAPGTVVLVKPGCELLIQGAIEAVDPGGTISFGSDGNGNWSGIRFAGSGGGTLNGVTIANADRGVAATGTGTVNLLNSILRLNDTGLHTYSGIIKLDKCLFEQNQAYGVKEDNGCSPVVTNCTFRDNGVNYYDEQYLRVEEDALNSLPNNSGNIL